MTPVRFEPVAFRSRVKHSITEPLRYPVRGHRYKFQNYDVFLSLKVVLILANSADPDKISSGSSLFAKVLIQGFPGTQRFKVRILKIWTFIPVHLSKKE